MNGYNLWAVHAVNHMDAGVVPYNKGTVKGFVWNDLESDGNYDGLWQRNDKGVPDVEVTLQYRRNDKDSVPVPEIKEDPDAQPGNPDDDGSGADQPEEPKETTEAWLDGGKYFTVFTYEAEHFDLAKEFPDLTVDTDYFISGRYLFPLTQKAEDAMLPRAMEYRWAETKNKQDAADKRAEAVQAKAELRTAQEVQAALERDKSFLEKQRKEVQAQLDELMKNYGKLSTISQEHSIQVQLLNLQLSQLRTEKTNLDKELFELEREWNTKYGSGTPDSALSPEELKDKKELEAAIAAKKAEIAKKQKEIGNTEKLRDQYQTMWNQTEELLLKYTLEINKQNQTLVSIDLSLEENAESMVNALALVAEIQRRIEAAEREAERLENLAVQKPITTATYRTENDGKYIFEELPLIDDSMTPEDPRQGPLLYRVVVEKEANSEYSYHNAEENTHDGNDSDAGEILDETVYQKENLEALANKKYNAKSLGVSDPVQPVNLKEAGVAEGYSGKYQLIGPQDNVRVLDVGLLSYEKNVRIGDLVWNDSNRNHVQDAGERGVAGVEVTLYRYDAEAEYEYYPYQIIVDGGSLDKPDESSGAETGTPQKDPEAYMKPTVQVIKVENPQTVKGLWKPVVDANGDMTVTTDAKGRYSFTVPLADMANPIEPYQYRVMISQTGEKIYAWSDFEAADDDRVDSDVIPSSDFIDTGTGRMGVNASGELEVTGIYDSLGKEIMPKDAAAPEASPMGRVVGMLTSHYHDSISNIFDIYNPPEDTSSMPGVDLTKRVYFRFGQSDLTKDAGIDLHTPVRPPGTEIPDTPTPGGGGDGGGSGLIPPIPQTGGTMAVFILLLAALLAMVGYLLTGKKKQEEDEEEEKGTPGQNAGQG